MKKITLLLLSFLVTNQAHAELSVETITKLIKTFGPLFRIHHTDESSPASVDWMLAHSSLNLRYNDRSKSPVKLLDRGSLNSQLVGSAPYTTPNPEGEYYLNLEGDKQGLKKGPGYDAHNLSQQDCYVNAVERENGNVVLQFWCFYPWQGSIVIAKGLDYFLRDIGYHEGDWEHVNIYLKKSDEHEIGYEISQLFFARHQQKKGDLVKRDDLELVNDAMQNDPNGTHPVVYVGKNSHGTYPYVTRLSSDVDQTSAKGPSWKGWEHGKYIGTLLHPQAGQEWINFWGRWGSSVEASKFGITYHGDSPESPFLYNAFMHQGAHKKPIEIEGQKNNLIALQKPKKLRKSKQYSRYFTFDSPPKRIRLLEWKMGRLKKDELGATSLEPVDENISYELWEKKRFFTDQKIADGFSGKEAKLTPVYRIKNLYIANVRKDGKDFDQPDNLVVEIRIVED